MTLLKITHTSKLANEVLSIIRSGLDAVGIDKKTHLDEVIYTAIVILIACLISWAIRWICILILRKLLSIHKSEVAQDMVKMRIISKMTHIIPPLVLLSMLPFAFEDNHLLHVIILRTLWVYFVVAIGVGLNAFITLSWIRFDNVENTKRHPLRGLLGTAHGIVWIIVVIVSFSIIINKSPGYLLTGMAALSAAIMLIFKDSILGFVSGIQLSLNDMLRVGDWINVPSVNANGVVEDVTLTVVKLRGWDNTILMLPPYTLVSTSFQNYRGMYEIGRRRIEQEFIINTASIKPATDPMIETLSQKFPMLKEFIDSSGQNRNDGKEIQFNGGTTPINGTVETNIGLFRAYLCNYLLNHEFISKEQYLMVRLLTITEQGVPLQIYCFTEGDAVNWLKYEAVQSQIMEHIMAVAPLFELEIYNALSRNTITLENSQKEA